MDHGEWYYTVALHKGIVSEQSYVKAVIWMMLIVLLSVQHKKLPEWVDGNEWRYTVASEDSSNMEIDVSTSVKNGIMYLEDPVDHVSVPLFCLCLC